MNDRELIKFTLIMKKAAFQEAREELTSKFQELEDAKALLNDLIKEAEELGSKVRRTYVEIKNLESF